jgi:hypothetical protein
MVEDVVDGEFSGSTAFIDGVRKFALSVTDLDIDLIDRVNPFDATYAVLAKAMDEKTLIAGAGCHQRQEGQADLRGCPELTERAVEFKRERGRLLADVAGRLGAQDGRRHRLPAAPCSKGCRRWLNSLTLNCWQSWGLQRSRSPSAP